MARFVTKISLLLGGVGIAAGVAVSGGVSGFDGLFSSSPCMDGWAGCQVKGFMVDAGPVRDQAGHPLPADSRIGWFDLKPQLGLSPFAGLSDYGSGAPPSASPAVADAGGGGDDSGIEEPAPVEQVAQANPPADNWQPPLGNSGSSSSNRGTGAFTGGGSSSSSSSRSVQATSGGQAGNEGRGASNDRRISQPRNDVMQIVENRNSGNFAQQQQQQQQQQQVVEPPPVEVEEVQTVIEEVAVAEVIEPDPPPVEVPQGCDDLMPLEAPALMGRLSEAQVTCLENRIAGGASQTDKDKISRVLLVNAEAGGNRSEWARLARRHLEEIDRSDPDLCFQYAVYLSRGGVSRATRVIHWADYALENKSRWQGSTFQSRVFDLYRLRAQAASRLWEQATVDLNNADADREELVQKEERARGRAKTFALDWLDFARLTGQATADAESLCNSVAGNRNYCRDQ